jgi:hypothetical protein
MPGRGRIARDARRYRTQEVCPWNSGKFVTLTRERDLDGRERDRQRKRIRERVGTGVELPGMSLPSLISLMRMTYGEWAGVGYSAVGVWPERLS